jgi:probable phosphoglycerate mutase
MNLYVVRHGQTDLNKEKRIQGRKGLPLNETGIEQANIAKDLLKDIVFDFVYSSPLERAVQTAQIIVPYIKPIIDERINVYDAGEADNRKFADIQTLFGVIPDPTLYKGVEDIDQYIARVYNFIDYLKSKYANTDTNILLCAHRCTTGCVKAYFDGMPEDKNFMALASDNAEVKKYII